MFEIEKETKQDNLSFGVAITLIRSGFCVTRAGWNGKGQFVFLASSDSFHTQADLSAYDGAEVEVGDMLVMHTAQGTFQPGWLASQADLLADDWQVYVPGMKEE